MKTYKVLKGFFLANGTEGKAGETMELDMTEAEEKSLLGDESIEMDGVKKNETEAPKQPEAGPEEPEQPEAQDQGEVKG